METMRIGIDVRYLSHGLVGGVHTYIAHFVPALIDLAADHQIYLYTDTKRPFELHDLPDHVTVRLLPWLDPQKIVPVPHAPTPDLRRIEDTAVLTDVRRRHGLARPFVLADALKNPAVLVRAWRRLPAELRDSREIVFFSRRPDPLPIVQE